MVRWRSSAGGSRQRTFDTATAAREHRAKVETETSTGVAVDPKAERVTFASWVEHWLSVRELKPSTRAKVESLLRANILPEFGDVPLGKITQPDVARWVVRLRREGLAPSTVRENYQTLAGALASAVTARQLRESPCVGIELPKIEHHDMRFLDHRDVSVLAGTINPRYRALVLVLAYGGLRIGEAASLRRNRVNLLRGSVNVLTTASEVRGKWIEQTPKSKAARRTVPLPPFVVEALREHIEAYAEDSPDGLVFTASQGGPLRVATFRARAFKTAVRAAGLDPLRIHDLRHTAVSLWIREGADLLRVKKWAGHTRSTFTLDRYGHLYEDDDAALLGKMNAAIEANQHKQGEVVPIRVASVLGT